MSETETDTTSGATELSYPAWLDRTAYPFESHYMDLKPGRLHYVDEGEGRPVVMLHGNPTWSFLYRKLITGLSDEYRCIAPDYFGFGLSDKPANWSYRPADHARIVAEFIEELDLSDVTLVVHDWGGPIGMSYAIDNPDNVDGYVIQNSWMWPAEDRRARLFSMAVGGPVGRYLIRNYNVFADRIMRASFADSSRLDPVHDQYLEPLAEPNDRRGSWVFPREIRGSKDWLTGLWERRAEVTGDPALICWGMDDMAFGLDALRRWEALFPEARTVRFPDTGHYVAEERGTQMVPEVRSFLESL